VNIIHQFIPTFRTHETPNTHITMAESSVKNDKEGSDDEMPSGLVILSSDEMLVHGLQLLGWENKQLNR
jgi:hypothetical protein